MSMQRRNDGAVVAGANQSIRDLQDSTGALVMFFLCATSTALFFWLAYLQYARFTTETHEIMYMSYALAHSGSAGFLPLYFVEIGSLYGTHINVLWALLIPAARVIPVVPLLLFAQSFALSISAWPLYLLAREKLRDNASAVAIAGAYLLFPPVVSQHLNQIHDDQFANVWMILAALHFCRKKFWAFLVPLTLTCLTKEYFGLTAAMFGVWSLCERRAWYWVAAPLLWGFGYFLLAAKVLLPWFSGVDSGSLTVAYLSGYGATSAEIIRNLSSQPSLLLGNVFGPQKLWYLFTFFGPVLWVLPFLSPAIILAAPTLGMNLVGTNSAFIHIPWHYGVLLGAALFVALVCGLPFVQRRLTGRFGDAPYVRALAFALVFTNLLSHPLWFNPGQIRKLPHHDALRAAVDSIPLEAAVVCPASLLAHFSYHRKVTTASELLIRHKAKGMSNFAPSTAETTAAWREGAPALAEFDYVILDANWRNFPALAQQPALEWMQQTNLFQLVSSAQGVHVFQRQRSGF